jgi:beta-lactamase regulating signal transducer with metallopeptidase domain
VILDALIRASVAGTVAVGIAWMLVRLLPRLSPSACTFIWFCAAAKFVMALLWVSPMQLAVLPDRAPLAVLPDVRQTSSASVGGLPAQRSTALDAGILPATSSLVDPAAPATALTMEADDSVATVMLSRTIELVYLLGVTVAIGLAARQWRRMRAMVDRAPLAPEPVQSAAAELASMLGVTRVPLVRVSPSIDTPLVAGIWRPVILLPGSGLARLPWPQLRMVLCHELAHVRRRDLPLGGVPALAERLFFFHPLAHVAAREFALWREAACDAMVLETLGAPPRDYGRLLLDLGIARRHAGLAAATAPWSLRHLKRRLLMLGTSSSASLSSRFFTAAAICVSLVVLAPMQLVGREQEAPPPPAAAPSPPAPVAMVPVAPAALPAPPAPPAPVPALPATPATRAAMQVPPAAPARSSVSGSDFMLLTSDDQMVWHAGSRDHMRIRSLQRNGEPMLWFRYEGAEYVVRDPEVVAQAEAIWQPLSDIGKTQGELGAKQGALGAEQGKHGAAMGELGAEQGELGSRLGELAMKQASLSLQAAGRELSAEEKATLKLQEDEIRVEMKKLQEEMEALSLKMREFEAPMRDLQKQMEPLAKEMRALGDKMSDAAKKAEAEMRQLMESAVKEGKAEKVK